MSRYLVTITPPTPNGDLHLGHMAGPFLAADVFAKVRKMLGDEVVLLSYADDYQSYMARKGEESGEHWLDLSRDNTRKIEKTMLAMGIDADHFMHSGENGFFIGRVQQHLNALAEKGVIKRVEGAVPYDQELEKYGYEAFARGTCPECGYSTDPSQCENCACYPDAGLMANLHSPITKKPLEVVKMTRLAVDMRALSGVLKDHYIKHPARRQLGAFIDQHVFSGYDQMWPIERTGDAGIPVEFEGADILVSTWFSGLAGYEAALTEYWARKMRPAQAERFWREGDAKVAHFLGFDCSYSHALIYPAIASLVHENPPEIYHYTNAFLKLDNEDFSTSRNYAIWAGEFVAEHGVDAVRFFLAIKAPEEVPENFSLKEFVAWKDEYLRIGKSLLSVNTAGVSLSLSLAEAFARWRSVVDKSGFSMRSYASFIWDLFASFSQSSDELERQEKAALIAMLSGPLLPDLSKQMASEYLASLYGRLLAGATAPLTAEALAECEAF